MDEGFQELGLLNFLSVLVIICEENGSQRFEFISSLYTDFFRAQKRLDGSYVFLSLNEASKLNAQSIFNLCSHEESTLEVWP